MSREEFFSGFWLNVLTNTATAVVVFLLVQAVVRWQRRALKNFFGLNQRSASVVVYFSRLQIKSGGTAGNEDIVGGYVGPAINKLEYDAALTLRDLLRPGVLTALPKWLKFILSPISGRLEDIEVDFQLSPVKGGYTFSTSPKVIVVVGGAVYNSAAAYHGFRPAGAAAGASAQHESERAKFFEFTRDAAGERAVRVVRGATAAIPIQGRSAAPPEEIGTIERVNTKDGVSIFLCNGLGSAATYASVRYLAQHWRKLYDDFGSDEFAIYLRLPGQARDGENVMQPVHVQPVSHDRYKP
jgi:hypothetical protein